MVDVYYPYFGSEALWEELRYSLRSIEKHFMFDYRLVIVGDLPSWINPGSVLHIPHQRIEGIQENTLYDAITKQLLFNAHPDTSLSFVRMYDDIYILNDVDIHDIGTFKAMYPYNQVPQRQGTWWGQLYHTLDVLKQKGYPGWNTETHLPELFNKEKLQWIINIYGALENRLLTSSLYFNTFFPFADPVLFDKSFAIQFYDNVDGPYYTSSDGDLESKCQGKTYLNHNNAGLNDSLKSFLANRFKNKSRYEL
jgi:hypothetical protein